MTIDPLGGGSFVTGSTFSASTSSTTQTAAPSVNWEDAISSATTGGLGDTLSQLADPRISTVNYLETLSKFLLDLKNIFRSSFLVDADQIQQVFRGVGESVAEYSALVQAAYGNFIASNNLKQQTNQTAAATVTSNTQTINSQIADYTAKAAALKLVDPTFTYTTISPLTAPLLPSTQTVEEVATYNQQVGLLNSQRSTVESAFTHYNNHAMVIDPLQLASFSSATASGTPSSQDVATLSSEIATMNSQIATYNTKAAALHLINPSFTYTTISPLVAPTLSSNPTPSEISAYNSAVGVLINQRTGIEAAFTSYNNFSQGLQPLQLASLSGFVPLISPFATNFASTEAGISLLNDIDLRIRATLQNRFDQFSTVRDSRQNDGSLDVDPKKAKKSALSVQGGMTSSGGASGLALQALGLGTPVVNSVLSSALLQEILQKGKVETIEETAQALALFFRGLLENSSLLALQPTSALIANFLAGSQPTEGSVDLASLFGLVTAVQTLVASDQLPIELQALLQAVVVDKSIPIEPLSKELLPFVQLQLALAPLALLAKVIDSPELVKEVIKLVVESSNQPIEGQKSLPVAADRPVGDNKVPISQGSQDKLLAPIVKENRQEDQLPATPLSFETIQAKVEEKLEKRFEEGQELPRLQKGVIEAVVNAIFFPLQKKSAVFSAVEQKKETLFVNSPLVAPLPEGEKNKEKAPLVEQENLKAPIITQPLLQIIDQKLRELFPTTLTDREEKIEENFRAFFAEIDKPSVFLLSLLDPGAGFVKWGWSAQYPKRQAGGFGDKVISV